jgi:hypothetical protein
MTEINQNIPLTAGRYMRGLKTLHTALLAGMMLFAAVVVILLGTKSIKLGPGGNIHGILQFLVPVVCVAGFFGGNMIFKQKLDAINGHGGSLLRRLTDYRTAR